MVTLDLDCATGPRTLDDSNLTCTERFSEDESDEDTPLDIVLAAAAPPPPSARTAKAAAALLQMMAWPAKAEEN